MRALILTGLIVLCSISAIAQDSDSALKGQLETLHAKWFKAFDGGDGATMDHMETPNLTLVMPDGEIWPKTKPRAGTQQKSDRPVTRTLSDVSVRRFGDVAILTGTVTSKYSDKREQSATTVVFVQSAGNWKIASAQWSDRNK